METMPAKMSFSGFVYIRLWQSLPGFLQKLVSKFYTTTFNQSFSKYFIKTYCRLNYDDSNYLEKFVPASGKSDYTNFQDFFTRKYKEVPEIQGEYVWPCNGFLCEYGPVRDLNLVKVKGDKLHIREVFGERGQNIPKEYFYTNIFLHNKHYHRIHTPVTGKVIHIERIPGSLAILRPWFYNNNSPSYPAIVNERVNMEIEDAQGRIWYLSIVGGPAVRTVEIKEGIEVGATVEVAEELATFLLGSTCCIASPEPVTDPVINKTVNLGDQF